MKALVLLSPVLLGWGFAGEVYAKKEPRLKPILVSTGNVLLDEDFSKPTLGKLWQVNKGEWKLSGEVVVGREKAEDKHAAVLTCKIPNRNSAILVTFKLGDAKAFHVSFNKKHGHLFRVIVTQDGLLLRTDKPNKKSKIAPVVLAKSSTKFDKNRWYSMLLEVGGQQVAVQTDNGVTVKGSHSSLDVDKPSYRFILRGQSLQLDHVTIWNAKP